MATGKGMGGRIGRPCRKLALGRLQSSWAAVAVCFCASLVIILSGVDRWSLVTLVVSGLGAHARRLMSSGARDRLEPRRPKAMKEARARIPVEMQRCCGCAFPEVR